MSPKPQKRISGGKVVIVASAVFLVVAAAALIFLQTQTFYQPLMQTALLLLLPAAINLLLLVPVAKARPDAVSEPPPEAKTDVTPQEDEAKPPLPLGKRILGTLKRACVRVVRVIASRRTVILTVLIILLAVAVNIFFWRYTREKSYSNLLAYYQPVIMAALFVLFIVFGKWCKHSVPATASAEQAPTVRYEMALLRNLQSAFALGRIATVLLAVGMVIYLIGLYDFSRWLVVIFAVLFAYEVVFMAISLFVVLVRREFALAPEVTAPMPGVEGGDLGILNYLEKNTGITMRSLWSIQMIKRAIPYAALLSVFLLWGVTGISLIGSHQQGAHYRFGRLQEETLSPGLHFTLPWPFDKVEVYDTETVNKMTIGYIAEGDADNLWTESHGTEEYRLLLGGGNELVSINLRLMYRISDLRAYLTSSAAPEVLMSSAAYEIVTARTITSDLDSMLSTDRAVFAETFREELTVYLEKYGTGLEVTSVVLESIHPPVEIADAYQALISAEIQADQICLDAESYAARRVAFAWVEYDTQVSNANIAYHEGVAEARATVAEFMASVGADNAYYCPNRSAEEDSTDACMTLLVPGEEKDKYVCSKCHAEYDKAELVSASAEYRYYRYMKAISEAYADAKLIIVGDGVNEENLYIGNISGGN